MMSINTLPEPQPDSASYIVNNHIDKATGAHFISPGHSLANMTCTLLEQLKYNNTNYRRRKNYKDILVTSSIQKILE